jgi:hypothetical protein
VDVGYSQMLPGIDIDFDPSGLAGGLKPQAPSHKLQATVIRSQPQGVVAFDAMGRRVLNPKSGIYFVRDEGQRTKDGPTGGVRKVVIQR